MHFVPVAQPQAHLAIVLHSWRDHRTPHGMCWSSQIQQLVALQIPLFRSCISVEHGYTTSREADKHSVFNEVNRVYRRRQSDRMNAFVPVGHRRVDEQVSVLAANPDCRVFAGRDEVAFRVHVRWPVTFG